MRISFYFIMLFVVATLRLVQCRAPDVQSPEVPNTSLWCDKKVGTPTRTTGECICKYGCEGSKCIREQGFNFYSWRSGMEGQAKCIPPVERSESERTEIAAKRKADRERQNQHDEHSQRKSEPASSSHEGLGDSSLTSSGWREWAEDLEWTNVAVALVAVGIFGTVLVAMVVLGVYGVRDAVSDASTAASAPINGKRGD